MTEPSNVMIRKKQPQFFDDSFDDFHYKREIKYFMRDCKYGLICAKEIGERNSRRGL